MKTEILADDRGKLYDAYVATLSDGSTLYVDVRLANFFGNHEEFVADEVKLAEKAIKESP